MWPSLVMSGVLGLASIEAGAGTSLNDFVSVQFVSNAPYDQQLAAVRSMAVKRVRIAVRANDVVKGGRYSWDVADAKIQPLLRNGIWPIIDLYGAPGSPAEPASFARAYADFAAATVKHFGTRAGAAPILYELWNEPNTKTFWGSPPNPETYALMAQSACEAMKRVDLNVRVLGLAMEGTPLKAPYFVPAYKIDIYREWAGRAYTTGLAACLDGVSIHPYRPVPETYIEDEPALAEFLRRSWRKPGQPMVVNSEWGYAVDHKRGVTSRDQAALDMRLILIGAGFGRVTNLYQAVDPRDPGAPLGDGYGVVDSAGADKSSARALKSLLKIVGDCRPEPAHELPNAKAVYAEAFSCPSEAGRRRAVAVWSTVPGQTIPAKILGLSAGALETDLVLGSSKPAGDLIALSTMPLMLTSD